MLHARNLRAQQRGRQPAKAVENGAAVGLDNAKGHPLGVSKATFVTSLYFPCANRLSSIGKGALTSCPEGVSGAWGLGVGPRARRTPADATDIRHAHAEQPAPVRLA